MLIVISCANEPTTANLDMYIVYKTTYSAGLVKSASPVFLHFLCDVSSQDQVRQ
uniref:Uncharacterized protein n=1 Tax=Arundo donax TaxID=35708 RepID=A0A0A9HE90_ARUDO